MSTCIDERFEQMLYAFELGLLDESNSQEFDVHLYQCEHCFGRAQRFEGAVGLLLV